MQLEHEGPLLVSGKTPTTYIVIPHYDSRRSRRRTGKVNHLSIQFVRSGAEDAIEPPYRPTPEVIRSMTRSKYRPHVGAKQAAKQALIPA